MCVLCRFLALIVCPSRPFYSLAFWLALAALLSDLPHRSGPGLPVWPGGLGKVEVSRPWPQDFNSWGVVALTTRLLV